MTAECAEVKGNEKKMNVNNTIALFDNFLSARNVRFEAVIIGGAALNVMGIISRQTADIDCLDPQIPEEILRAANEFRTSNKELRLIDNWINNGPDGLIRDLPPDWQLRVSTIYRGKAIILHTLGRPDLLRTKLFAFCDRDIDLPDCIALKPTLEELEECFPWVSERDASPQWPKNVYIHFEELKKELGYVI